MTNPNDQAFPSNNEGFIYPGLTVRAYFAAQALPACIASIISAANRGTIFEPKIAAQSAVEYADLLIAELTKEK